MITREFYQNRVENMLRMWKNELEALNVQLPEATKTEYEIQLSMAVAKQSEAEQMLQELKQMGNDGWGEYGLNMERMLYSLQESFVPLWAKKVGQRPN